MPERPSKTLHKFMLNLVEKPQALARLKKDPAGFISQSALAKTHKKILLSGDAKKIKALVSKVVAGPTCAIVIQTGSAPQPSAEAEDAIHIVFGARQPVKVSLKRADFRIVTGAKA